MRKVLHISDLHFGRTDSAVVAGLRQIAERIEPHVVAVSGDLTQRARPREFEAARVFLDSLPGAKIVVPGNHDIPLYNVLARFRRPLERYRHYVGDLVETAFLDDEIAVVGVNTARSLAFKGGRINREQVQRARELFCATASERIRILVTHHPFDLPDSAGRRDLVGRAHMAMSSLRECLPDVLLAGHLHLHELRTTAERYDLGGHSAIVVQAGTATSTRARGEHNSFNLIRVDRPAIDIERYDWSPLAATFESRSTRRFTRWNQEWTATVSAEA